ncbi:uncharacterized protein LOC111274236 [Durio zibethinus]|uniref:Uncharacterized protein LOC111274236 n=1 Tax=Durio zibethinus TaxID=66656 RepID=A0A6P5WGQ2_DURZI|nr:uncharacterized protein LOC111274236 [Durio zibethinus]
MQTPVRFSSCRGVAFEIKPHANPFAIPTPAQNEPCSSSKKSWFPWYLGSSSGVFPNSSIQRSVSGASSHFCDLDLDEDENENEDDVILERLEEGKDEEKGDKPIFPSLSKSEQKPKPTRKQESRLSVILLDQGLFTVYKRLFVVCLTLNIIGLGLAATGHFPYARNRAALFSIANILALTLCRSEAFLRVVFWLAVKVLGRSWVPFPIKTATTYLLQSLGGMHSSCGISSVAWLIYALVLTLNDRENTSPEIIGVASTSLSLLCLSCLAAFPLVRHLHHNVFERIHRFAGWTALGLLWAFIILTIFYDPITKSYFYFFNKEILFWVLKPIGESFDLLSLYLRSWFFFVAAIMNGSTRTLMLIISCVLLVVGVGLLILIFLSPFYYHPVYTLLFRRLKRHFVYPRPPVPVYLSKMAPAKNQERST